MLNSLKMETNNKVANGIKIFNGVKVWKEGMNLTVELYKLLSGCRDFGFGDQLQRAAVSILHLPFSIHKSASAVNKNRLFELEHNCHHF